MALRNQAQGSKTMRPYKNLFAPVSLRHVHPRVGDLRGQYRWQGRQLEKGADYLCCERLVTEQVQYRILTVPVR
jgi:hypothetical protein